MHNESERGVEVREQAFLDHLLEGFNKAGIELTQDIWAVASRAMHATAEAFATNPTTGWRSISELPRKGMFLGYNAAFDPPYWLGSPYDLAPGALVDFKTGRWRQMTHFAEVLPPPPTTPTGERG